MNLIEEFGGYECAKAEFNDPMYEDDELYTIKVTGTRFFKHNLADALLEYRRANNIFEVNDKVIDTTGFFDWLCKVDYLSTDGRVVMYKYDQRKGDTAFTTWPFIETVRHATDEEIEAGKRLDSLKEVT